MTSRVVLGLAVLGLAGVWGAALYWPKEVVPLPDAYVGEWFIAAERVSPDDQGSRPLPPGQERTLTFRRDGTYLFRIRLPGGGEMLRREGIVTFGNDVLTLQLLAENRRATPAEPDRFRTRWETVGKDTFLVLAHEEHDGYELHLLRRATP